MTILSVNLNKVALVRNSRDTTSPSPVEFAAIAVAAGAEGITVHQGLISVIFEPRIAMIWPTQ